MRPRTRAPFKLSTAKVVLRWSSYARKANPRDFPVSLRNGRLGQESTSVGKGNRVYKRLLVPAEVDIYDFAVLRKDSHQVAFRHVEVQPSGVYVGRIPAM